QAHTVEAVIDRVVVRKPGSGDGKKGAGDRDQGSGEDDGLRARVADSIELALKLADGLIISSDRPDPRSPNPGPWSDVTYSEKWSCPEHPECSLEDLEPRLFSFN